MPLQHRCEKKREPTFKMSLLVCVQDLDLSSILLTQQITPAITIEVSYVKMVVRSIAKVVQSVHVCMWFACRRKK